MFQEPKRTQSSTSRSFAIVLSVCGLLLLVSVLAGKRVLESFVRERTKPWAVFRVPQNPTPLAGLETALEANAVVICNRGEGDWSDVLIQIDQGYLAALDRLRKGECKQIPVHNFTTESWKRMPPPRDLQVTRVAVLANFVQKGYAARSVNASQ
jgi:hypothetical protein